MIWKMTRSHAVDTAFAMISPQYFCVACSMISCVLVLQPLLDVILFTRSLSRSMGYRGQLVLYLYYLLSAGALRQLSPPLALMTAQESSLSGGFRAAHQVCDPTALALPADVTIVCSSTLLGLPNKSFADCKF